LCIIGVGAQTKTDRRLVGLLREGQMPEQFGALLDTQHQDPGGHRIQGPCMSHTTGACQSTSFGDHVVRGPIGGFVDHHDTALCHGTPAGRTWRRPGRPPPKCHSLSSTSSRGVLYGSGSPTGFAPAARSAFSSSSCRAWASNCSMCCAFSCTSSSTKVRVGVWRTPVCRPTSLRITPLALSSAAAVDAFSSGSPNTV